jgi:hypothetical protein
MNSAQTLTNLINNWKASGVTKAELIVMAGEAMIGWPYAWGATGQKCTVANREARIKNPRISEGDIKLIRERCQVLSGRAKSCDGCKYYPAGVTQTGHPGPEMSSICGGRMRRMPRRKISWVWVPQTSMTRSLRPL